MEYYINSMDSTESKFNNVEHVGKYCLGGKYGFCIMFVKKPNMIHRFFMKLLLGWEWIDTKINNNLTK